MPASSCWRTRSPPAPHHRRLLVHLIDQLRQPCRHDRANVSDSFSGIAPASVPLFLLAQIVGGGVGYGLARTIYPSATLLSTVQDDHDHEPDLGDLSRP